MVVVVALQDPHTVWPVACITNDQSICINEVRHMTLLMPWRGQRAVNIFRLGIYYLLGGSRLKVNFSQ